MAVSTFCEIWNGRDFSDDVGGIVSFTRQFQIVTDTNTDDAGIVRAYSQVPRIGDIFPSFPNAKCRNVRARNESDDPRNWIVTATYSNEDSFVIGPSPTGEPAIITWTGEQFQEAIKEDKDGKPITNSAGDPFIPPVVRDNSRAVVIIRKNLTNVPTWILDYQDAVNSSSFTLDGVSIGARIAKVQRVSVGEVKERNDETYRELEIEMHLDRRTWDIKTNDMGFRQLIFGIPLVGVAKVNILDQFGEPIREKVWLDGSGRALPGGSDPTDSSIITDRVYEELDFSVLPLT